LNQNTLRKFQKLGLGGNEEHLNSKQMIFKYGNHKGLGMLLTQFHPQTLQQNVLPNFMPCMDVQGHLQHQNA